MAEKSKILVIGATGYIGKFIVGESIKVGHPTFALVRDNTVSNPEKSELIESFKSSGVTLFYGDIYNHESLVEAIKRVDVVISTVGSRQLADQINIIAAIKEAGNVKRFLPSEFGKDVDRSSGVVEPAASLFGIKQKIRREIEAQGIPHTYVASYGFIAYALHNLGQPDSKVPPRDKLVILGDGNTKAIFVAEKDVASYTIKAVEDTRTLNKTLHLRPPANILSFNEIVSLWENKINKTLEKIYVLEDQLLKQIQESPMPLNIFLSIAHSSLVKGDAINIELDPSSDVDASVLYPDLKYTTVDEYLDHLV